MGRIVIPRPTRRATGRRASLRAPEKYGYFSRGFGPQEMSLVSKLADLAVAGGGQIARAVQISNREEEQAEAQAEYDRRLQSEIESRQRAAQAEIAGTDIDGQVEAFFAQQEPPSVRERLPSMSDMSLQSTLVQPRPMQRGALSPGVLARPDLLAPEDVSALRSAAELMQHQSNMAGQMRSAEGIVGRTIGDKQVPEALFTHPMSPEGQAMRQLTVQERLRRMAPDIAAGRQLVRGDDPQVSAALGADPSLTYRPQTVGAADPYDAAQRRAELQQAMQGRDFRQEAIEAVGPAPEAKLFRIADILAAAPSARTAEQRAMLLQAAVDSPDIQAANLSDLAKGAYRDRAMQAVMKLFPEEEEPMSELDMLRAEYLRQQTLTSKSLQDERNARIKAAQDKADKDALRKSRSVPGRTPDDQRVFDSLMNHRRDFQSFQEGTGRYSTANIAASLGRRFGENRQYTPEEIQTVREQLWSSRTGPLSGATDADREDLAMGMFSTRRSGKKFGGIVKGIKQADEKAINQALRESKEGRIAEKQETSLEHARNREQRSRSKFENELTKGERELAKSRALLGISNPKSEAGRAQFLNNYVNEQERILRGKKGVSPSTPTPAAAPAPSGAVYTAPITDEDLKFVESVRQKHGQQN